MEEQQQYHQNNESRPPQKQPKGPMRPAVVVTCVICGCIMFLGFWYILFSQFFGNLFGAVAATTNGNYTNIYPVGNTVDVLYVEGVIQEGSATYQHNWTLNKINELMDNKYNKGIFLYVNSPGGGVYESDELYLKLKEYKETTGRPVYAYMAQTAASGGVYVSMAADKIYASRMTMTGSIGVITSLLDTTGLQELIGVKEDNITSGANKSMGNPLTDEQREIFQSIVNEYYDIFVGVVADSRKLDLEKVYELADGRVYSPVQAKELGLIDEIGTYEEAVENMRTTYDLQDVNFYHQEPPVSLLNELLSSVSTELEGSKAVKNFDQVTKYIEKHKSPTFMYYMQ